LIYHVLNRAAGRLRLFRTDRDYLAFERIVVEALQRHPIRILDYVIMPNHWHFAVWPREDDEVTNFFRWLAHTHSMRWHTAKHVIGIGPLYQGRFKSFPVENDDRTVLTVLRYMSRNPLRAGLVRSAIDWRWGGLHVRANRLAPLADLLVPWPVDEPRDWLRVIDEPMTPAEEEAVRTAIRRSRPFGSPAWIDRTARKLGLDWTLHPRGRPKLPASPRTHSP
jgi:putative transposase